MALQLLIMLAWNVQDDDMDRNLAERIRENDDKAFRLFYEKYQRPLYSFLMSKGVPSDQAEDLVQNAFLIIWEKRAGLEPGRSLRSFLFTIAYNRMLNYFRDRKNQSPEYAYTLHDTGRNPEENLSDRQTLDAVQKALEKMPEKRRQVFELCYLQEFSYKEAAEILNVAAKTIENHMALALKDLRSALKHLMDT